MPRLRLTAPRRLLGLLAALSTGLLLVFSFPGPDLGAVAFVALVPLLLVARTRRPLIAGGLGLLAGLLFFAIHVTWVSAIGDDRLAGGFAWGALVLLQAAFMAAFFALVPAAERLGLVRIPLLAAAWATIELVRAHVPFGGFAWGQLGLTQHDGGPLLPLASVAGVYGLSAVIVAVNLAVAAALAARGHGWRPAAGWLVLAAALPLLGLVAPGLPPAAGPAGRLAVIQGNVPFDRDNRGRTNREVFANHVRMTRALAGGPRPDLVVWAEGAADDDPLVNLDRGAEIRQAAQLVGAPMLIGATTEQGEQYATEGLLFTEQGRLADRYVKRRLVPFGEYIPFGALTRQLVPATRQLPYDKRPGDRLEPMFLDGTRFGVLICYESAYPEDTSRLAREGAQFMVLLTNNASFGRTPLGRQHLAHSQLRAVEQGRTVVHAAISGTSAVIGPDGRASQVTGLYEAATVNAEVVPRAGLTVYGRVGRSVEAGLVGLSVALLVALGVRRRREQPADLAGERPAAPTGAVASPDLSGSPS